MTALSRLLPAAVAVLFVAAPVRAETRPDPLRDELAGLAKSIKDVLEEEKQAAIAVGDFTGPPQLDSAFGPGIQAALIDELKRLAVTVNKRADLSITGNYADAKEDVNGEVLLIVKINARILARNGDELLKLSQRLSPSKIKDNATIAKVTGATVSLPPAGDKTIRNEAIQRAIADPKVHVEGTRVAARPGGLLAVEVLAKPAPGGKSAPRTPQVQDGQAYVAIDRDEIYELHLHNRNDCEAAMTVNVDGVDVFAFSKDRDAKTGRPRFSHFILGPASNTRIAGWHVTNDPAAAENVYTFKVTEFGKGGVSQLGIPRGKVGTITVTYAAAAASKEGLPADERDTRSAGNETGFGPGEKQNLKAVQRAIGGVREVVTIRYNR